jgi:hypothetical protein
VLEGFQESLVAYKETAKRANNPDGVWSSSSLLMCRVSSHTFVMFKGHAFVDVWSDSMTIVNNVMD